MKQLVCEHPVTIEFLPRGIAAYRNPATRERSSPTCAATDSTPALRGRNPKARLRYRECSKVVAHCSSALGEPVDNRVPRQRKIRGIESDGEGASAGYQSRIRRNLRLRARPAHRGQAALV